MHTNPNDTRSQADLILRHLQQGHRLTPLEAEKEPFHCLRLGARVWDLKKSGYPIRAAKIKTPSGKWVSQYWIDAVPADA